MSNCIKCGKKLGIFGGYVSGEQDYCEKCYDERNLEINKNKGFSLKESKIRSKKVIEMRCTCKECGNVWHYLPNEEKVLRNQARSNAFIGIGNLFNPMGALFSNKSLDLQRELVKFNKCPKCNSVNITKQEIEICN